MSPPPNDPLLPLALDLARLLDEADVARVAAERAQVMLAVAGCRVYGVDQSRQRVVPLAAAGTALLGELLAQQVLDTGCHRSVAGPLNLSAWPLRWQDQVIGILVVGGGLSGRGNPLVEPLADLIGAALGHARLHALAATQAKRLAVLHQASQAIGRPLDPEHIYQATYEAVSRLMQADAFAIALLDETDRHVEGVFLVDRGERQPTQLAGLAQGLAGHVLRLGLPVLFHTATEWPPGVVHFGGGQSVQSVAAVPMQIGDRVFGVLAAEAYAPQAFGEEDLSLLATVANQAAVGLSHARRFQAVSHRVTELTILHEIALAAVSASTTDKIIEHTVDILQQRLSADVLGLGLLDDTQEHYHAHPSYRGADGHIAAADHLPITRGLVGLAIRTGEPVRVDDVSQHPDYVPAVPTTQSELVVPLKIADRVIGALNVEMSRPAAFSERDEQLLTIVAGVLAPIIENARLRDAAQQQARDLDVLVRAQQAASASLDVHAVLTATVQQLGRALDVTSAYLVEVSGNQAVTVAEYYSPEAGERERVSDLKVAYPAGVFVHALEAMDSGQIVRVSVSDERTAPSEREHLLRFGGRTAFIVPLQHQGRALGYVRLWDSRSDRLLTEPEQRLARSLAGSAAVALENARLYAGARRYAEQMQLVNEIGRDISGILDVETLLAQVCRRLEHGLGYYHVKLGLISGGEIAFPARDDERRGLALPAMRYALDGNGIIAWVARHSLPRHVSDVTAEPDFQPNPLLPATVSEAVIPLIAHGNTLGVLDLQSDRRLELGPEEVAVLEAISGQVAVAVDNARLFAEARQRTAEVSALLATTLTVASSLELPARLEAIAQQARQLSSADSVSIYRLSADGAQLLPMVALDEFYAEETLSDVIVVGEGLIGYVAQTGEGQIFNRADRHPRAKTIAGTPDTPECMMVVPLAVGARGIGVMAVYREGEREFSPHDFDLLSSFAAQAAAAIENVELYQALRERAESLQETYDELAEMNRLKDEMVQNISHELRTPLTFLRGYVDLLLNGDLGPLLPEQQHSLAVVRDKTETLVRLVNDIITLQAVTPASIARLPVNLLVLAQKAADGAAVVAQAAGVSLDRELPAGSLTVLGDAVRLSQVFDNLLSNAIKFTSRGGRIGLRVVPKPDWVRVEVRDSGIGIAPEFRDRIFERFYQVDGTITRRRGGLGLGLAICKLIIEAHGGQIGVESEPTQGSCFYFVLPRES